MYYYKLTPQDAWFFRDGRPYNQGESNQSDVVSQFPPSARTLTGALRAALARVYAWDGKSDWSTNKTIVAALGSGADNLAEIQFSGPFLIRGGSALWPAPLHLFGKPEADHWAPNAFLRPSARKTLTDKGWLNLPEIALPREDDRRNGLKPAENRWVTADGLGKIISGSLPAAADISSSKELWKIEHRIGLIRNEKTCHAEEGALYSPAYIRLAKGVELGVGLSGLPTDIGSTLPELFPLGGESRLAQCECALQFTGDLPFPAALAKEEFSSNAEGNVHFTVLTLTPLSAFINIATELGKNVEVVSASIGKPLKIGGWDSLKREPIPLEPFQPAGSVWFCRAPAADFPAVLQRHGTWLGERRHTAHGYGQIIIGHWPR
jgi:CRISPR-associated protein Cmr3